MQDSFLRCVSTIALGASLLAGCASVDVVQVTNRTDPAGRLSRANPKGIRVFAPRTYVVVAGSQVSTVVLPDCAREYAVRPFSLFAKHDFKMTLSNGMITELSSNQDSTQIPDKILSVLEGLLKPGPSSGAEGTNRTEAATQGEATVGIFAVGCEDGQPVAQLPDRTPDTQFTDQSVTTVRANETSDTRGTGKTPSTNNSRSNSETTTTTVRTTTGSTDSPMGRMIRAPAPYNASAGAPPAVPQDAPKPAKPDKPAADAAPGSKPPGSGPATEPEGPKK